MRAPVSLARRPLRIIGSETTDPMSPIPVDDEPSDPARRARREFATQLALWVICDEEKLEQHARAQRTAEDLQAWAGRALSDTIAITHLDNVDYGRLYALLR